MFCFLPCLSVFLLNATQIATNESELIITGLAKGMPAKTIEAISKIGLSSKAFPESHLIDGCLRARVATFAYAEDVVHSVSIN